MAAFSQAQHEAVIHEIETGLATFEHQLAYVVPAANTAASQRFVPAPVAQGFRWIAEETVAVGRAILDWFQDLLKGATAPIFMFIDSWRWMDIKGKANTAATDLTRQNLVIDDTDWSGTARDAYLTAAVAQSTAAARIGSIAANTAQNLLYCAAAGLAFYIVLAGVLAKLIAALAVSIAGMSSGIFTAPGIALFLEEAGVSTAVIVAAVSTLAAFLAAQATAMITLHGEAVDPTSFPHGAWPTTNTNRYADATVLDGDADWSLKHD
ncbi:hypothetical protein [Mangrovihabitans endophyticus]|uniref:Uncharacterized protein n=1 Tax=Mangrovihabitans endophyticus TaxID=1751298 RepID=A0A8J3C363_9ACTN|nr:hypothetical protein [Mangrovihabitans endophyticus]GGL11831.1 hypothetical protein GCM10012284_53240 [Mangrovihabitans endophyticus]